MTNNPVRKLIKHSYTVKFINRTTGVVFDSPFIAGSYLSQLCEIGEFEITVPNGWVQDRTTGAQKLTRNEIIRFDIVQIFRDSTIVFSGIVLAIKRDLSTIRLTGKS